MVVNLGNYVEIFSVLYMQANFDVELRDIKLMHFQI